MKSKFKGFGRIKACGKHVPICNYKCCTFSNNYITLFPGEYEESDLGKTHLKITDDDYFGGKKAVCIKTCTSKSFIPLDCKSYPFFPRIDKDGLPGILKAKRCPLTEKELVEHEKQFLEIWSKLIKEDKICEWLKNVKEVGYEIDD